MCAHTHVCVYGYMCMCVSVRERENKFSSMKLFKTYTINHNHSQKVVSTCGRTIITIYIYTYHCIILNMSATIDKQVLKVHPPKQATPTVPSGLLDSRVSAGQDVPRCPLFPQLKHDTTRGCVLGLAPATPLPPPLPGTATGGGAGGKDIRPTPAPA